MVCLKTDFNVVVGFRKVQSLSFYCFPIANASAKNKEQFSRLNNQAFYENTNNAIPQYSLSAVIRRNAVAIAVWHNKIGPLQICLRYKANP
jgi:hypothetical protein